MQETLFTPKFHSRLVNADWLITWQVKQTLHYVNSGAVDGLLNECIRHYFFPLKPKKQRCQNNNNNNTWSQLGKKHSVKRYPSILHNGVINMVMNWTTITTEPKLSAQAFKVCHSILALCCTDTLNFILGHFFQCFLRMFELCFQI